MGRAVVPATQGLVNRFAPSGKTGFAGKEPFAQTGVTQTGDGQARGPMQPTAPPHACPHHLFPHRHVGPGTSWHQAKEEGVGAGKPAPRTLIWKLLHLFLTPGVCCFFPQVP